MIYVIVFSLFLTGCTSNVFKSSDSFPKREITGFDEWIIPGTFSPKQVFVVGLGDSLTEGVGDEYKRGGYFGRLTDAISNWITCIPNFPEFHSLIKKKKLSKVVINLGSFFYFS